MSDKLLTVKQVAERRGVSIWRIHQLIQAETLKAEKYGSQYLIKPEDADALKIYGKHGRPSKAQLEE